MKGRNLFVTALFMLVAGILLTLFHRNIGSDNVVMWCGILFLLSAIANVIFFLGARDKNGKVKIGPFGTIIGWIASAAAAFLALAMLIFPATFISLVPFLFGVLVCCAAVFQLFLLAFGSKPLKLNGWFFLVPMLLSAAAVYIFMLPSPLAPGSVSADVDSRIMLATGIAFALSGLATFVEGSIIAHGNYRLAHPKTSKTDSEATSEDLSQSTENELITDISESDDKPATDN